MADAAKPQRVVHTIAPIVFPSSQVLVLGTMPSPRSREVGFYYGNPQNRFWAVIAGLWDEEVPGDQVAAAHDTTLARAALDQDLVGEVNDARTHLCEAHHIALWDVLASCTIAGASDASIAGAVPNDIADLVAHVPIRAIFCTGATALRLYRRLVGDEVDIPCQGLPSTSPANARMRLADLLEAYAPLKDAADA